MDTTEAVTDTDSNPFLGKWFILSAIGMLMILVGAVILILHESESGDTPAPITASEKCDLPASDQTSITGIPETGWKWVGRGESAVAIPHTPEHGPAHMSPEGVPSCWARSPLGAVSAATAVAALGSAGMEHSLYRDLTVQGAERDQLLAETPENTEPYATGVTIEGFRLVDYTENGATVTVVAGLEGVYVAGTYAMTYTDGDWKYDPPTSLEPEFSQPSSLDGYNEFRGGPSDG